MPSKKNKQVRKEVVPETGEFMPASLSEIRAQLMG